MKKIRILIIAAALTMSILCPCPSVNAGILDGLKGIFGKVMEKLNPSVPDDTVGTTIFEQCGKKSWCKSTNDILVPDQVEKSMNHMVKYIRGLKEPLTTVILNSGEARRSALTAGSNAKNELGAGQIEAEIMAEQRMRQGERVAFGVPQCCSYEVGDGIQYFMLNMKRLNAMQEADDRNAGFGGEWKTEQDRDGMLGGKASEIANFNQFFPANKIFDEGEFSKAQKVREVILPQNRGSAPKFENPNSPEANRFEARSTGAAMVRDILSEPYRRWANSQAPITPLGVFLSWMGAWNANVKYGKIKTVEAPGTHYPEQGSGAPGQGEQAKPANAEDGQHNIPAIRPKLGKSCSNARFDMCPGEVITKNGFRDHLFENSGEFMKEYGGLVDKIANEIGVDPLLILAFIGQETDFINKAPNGANSGDSKVRQYTPRSGQGAAGYIQVMPHTAYDALRFGKSIWPDLMSYVPGIRADDSDADKIKFYSTYMVGGTKDPRLKPEFNIKCGIAYIVKFFDNKAFSAWNNNLIARLAAYNSGAKGLNDRLAKGADGWTFLPNKKYGEQGKYAGNYENYHYTLSMLGIPASELAHGKFIPWSNYCKTAVPSTPSNAPIPTVNEDGSKGEPIPPQTAVPANRTITEAEIEGYNARMPRMSPETPISFDFMLDLIRQRYISEAFLVTMAAANEDANWKEILRIRAYKYLVLLDIRNDYRLRGMLISIISKETLDKMNKETDVSLSSK